MRMKYLLCFVAIYCCFQFTSAKLLDESVHERLNKFDYLGEPVSDKERTFNKLLESNEDAVGSDDESLEDLIKHNLPKLSSKNKRFLGSILDIFRSKDKKTTVGAHDPYADYYTSKPVYQPVYPTSYYPMSSYKSSFTNSPSAVSDDPFYKLKQHCAKSYDEFCRTKKKDIYELVNRCSKLDKKTLPESCKEILSIYCYVFSTHDTMTCLTQNYDTYRPGVKKYTTASSTTILNRFSTPSTRIIPVIHVTSSSSYKPYSFPTRFSAPTAPPTARQSVSTSTSRSTSRPKANTDLSNPFNGPFTTIPNDSDSLKKIGQYCMKIKTKEPNCDKALLMLKDKFKKCEKSPKTDQECQYFKMNFCGAFSTFPCCTEVLAGRTCSGSKTMRRDLLFM